MSDCSPKHQATSDVDGAAMQLAVPADADAAHPPLRGESAPSCTAPPRSAASCTSISARKRWRSASCRRSAPRTPSSRPTASTATRWSRGIPARLGHGRDVRQAGRVQPRAGRLDASVRCEDAILRRQRHRRRRAAAGGRAGAGRQDARANRVTPASSATARWPRASSTSA